VLAAGGADDKWSGDFLLLRVPNATVVVVVKLYIIKINIIIIIGETFLVVAMFLGLVESLRVVVVVLAKFLQVLPSQTRLGIVMPAKIQNEKGMAAATK
jgi:hypothetical protein